MTTTTPTTFVVDMDADNLDAARPAALPLASWHAVTSAIATARCLGSRVATTNDGEGREWRARRTEQPGALYVVEQVQP